MKSSFATLFFYTTIVAQHYIGWKTLRHITLESFFHDGMWVRNTERRPSDFSEFSQAPKPLKIAKVSPVENSSLWQLHCFPYYKIHGNFWYIQLRIYWERRNRKKILHFFPMNDIYITYVVILYIYSHSRRNGTVEGDGLLASCPHSIQQNLHHVWSIQLTLQLYL